MTNPHQECAWGIIRGTQATVVMEGDTAGYFQLPCSFKRVDPSVIADLIASSDDLDSEYFRVDEVGLVSGQYAISLKAIVPTSERDGVTVVDDVDGLYAIVYSTASALAQAINRSVEQDQDDESSDDVSAADSQSVEEVVTGRKSRRNPKKRRKTKFDNRTGARRA